MYKYLVLGGIAVVGLAFDATAVAQDASGFYVGASIGDFSFEVDGLGRSLEGSNAAFKIFGGYTFNENLAVELARFDAGDPHERLGVFPIDAGFTGLNASAVGRLPLTDTFTLFGKIGIASYVSEALIRFQDPDIETFSAGVSDEDLSYGVGGEIRIGDRFGLRAEYEVVNDVEFKLLSLGGVFRF